MATSSDDGDGPKQRFSDSGPKETLVGCDQVTIVRQGRSADIFHTTTFMNAQIVPVA